MLKSNHQINTIYSPKLHPIVMGILNITPDSFSDGDIYTDVKRAYDRTFEMIRHGAAIIDVGGESTRPGASQVSVTEETDRILPVISAIRNSSQITISVDTRNAETAEQAISCGANIINDISALRHDENMIKVLQRNENTGIILMHMQGTPENMQQNPAYFDVVAEIKSFFAERIDFCVHNGINPNRIYLDPGIGFGKLLAHNLSILSNLEEFKTFGLPIVLGASRKRFISEINPSEPNSRLGGSLSTTLLAMQAGIDIIRVHDVQEHAQFISILDAVNAIKDAG